MATNTSAMQAVVTTNVEKALFTGRVANLGVATGCTDLGICAAAPIDPVSVDWTCYTMQPLYCDTRSCSWPIRGCRALISDWDATFVVAMVPSASWLSHTDFHDWAKDA